jgi:hypothetical protein
MRRRWRAARVQHHTPPERRADADIEGEDGFDAATLCACAVIVCGMLAWIGLVLFVMVGGLLYANNATWTDLRKDWNDAIQRLEL